MKALVTFIVFVSSLILASCDRLGGRLNTNPPDYIKNLTAYKEGSDGLMVYFILADKNGAMTTSDGSVTLSITETNYGPWGSTSETTLYITLVEVTKTDFRATKIGLGAFEHDAILCPLGRISYSTFTRRPSSGNLSTGKIRMTFGCPDDRELQGEEAVIF